MWATRCSWTPQEPTAVSGWPRPGRRAAWSGPAGWTGRPGRRQAELPQARVRLVEQLAALGSDGCGGGPGSPAPRCASRRASGSTIGTFRNAVRATIPRHAVLAGAAHRPDAAARRGHRRPGRPGGDARPPPPADRRLRPARAAARRFVRHRGMARPLVRRARHAPRGARARAGHRTGSGGAAIPAAREARVGSRLRGARGRAALQPVALRRPRPDRAGARRGGRGRRASQEAAHRRHRAAVLRRGRAAESVRVAPRRARAGLLPALDLQGGVPQGDGRGALALDTLVRDRARTCRRAPPLGQGAARCGRSVFGVPPRPGKRVRCRALRRGPAPDPAPLSLALRHGNEVRGMKSAAPPYRRRLRSPMLIVALLVAQAAAPVSKIPDMKPVAGIPSLLESGMPEVPPQLRTRIEQYQNSRSANALDVVADGSQLLIATRFASTNQLHVIEQPMGMRTQLTFGNEPVSSARFVPGDPRALLYLQDVGGGEFHQVFRLDRRTGRSELLTDGKSRHEGLIVSADGTRFAYSGTGRNGKDTDVYVAQTARPRDARRAGEREGTWQPVEFSRDGKRLLVGQFRAIDDADLHLYDLQTGELRQITPREGKGSVEDAGFSADGKRSEE